VHNYAVKGEKMQGRKVEVGEVGEVGEEEDV
jgi:hypothetical protein